jgi:hypothetical protein
MKTYTCPVCGFGMPDPPSDFNICASCGTEFGLHDSGTNVSELRREWIKSGAQWSSKVVKVPVGWNPYVQMLDAHLVDVTIGGSGDLTVAISVDKIPVSTASRDVGTVAA